ncbi:MAG: hypothetical protein ACRYFR_14130 [Janthinobacterium lividum]
MTATTRNLLFVLLFLLGMIPGYVVGHWAGVGEGTTIEKATHTVAAAKEGKKVSSQREKNENASRTFTPTVLDRKLRAAGWMRPNN